MIVFTYYYDIEKTRNFIKQASGFDDFFGIILLHVQYSSQLQCRF